MIPVSEAEKPHVSLGMQPPPGGGGQNDCDEWWGKKQKAGEIEGV